jgi:hypothetical protein
MIGKIKKGSGCCGANELTITAADGKKITYEVQGGVGLHGSYDYVFYTKIHGEGFSIVSNGNDENALD